LTADLGLRIEYRGPWVDQRGFNSNFLPFSNTFRPPLQNLTLQPWQTGRFEPNQALFKFNNKQGFQPRVGFAYRVTNKTVIRTGFGMFGNEPPLGMVQGMSTNPRPNSLARTYISDPTTPNLLLSNPFPSTITAGSTTPTITAFEDPLPTTQSYSWGFSIQQQLSARTVFDVGYQGSHTAHDYTIFDANDATPGPGAIQTRRPFPAYQSIRLIGGGGDSNYNGLEVRLEQRPGPSGVSALMSYTWSKTIDTMGGRLYSGGDPTAISRNMTLKNNRGQGEGNSNRLATTVGYELPFGKGKKFLPNGVGAAVAGGWSLTSILTLSSGFFVTAVVPSDIYNVGSTTTLRPDLLRNPNLDPGQRTPQKWFDTAAFALPTGFRYGNAGRSIIQGPGVINLDLALARVFNVTEKSRLQFRFDAFNSTNHTNFSLPGTSIGTSTFGVIGSAFESRDLQFGLKFYF
jgi:hypothetical protein